jgi:hypothetical protein
MRGGGGGDAVDDARFGTMDWVDNVPRGMAVDVVVFGKLFDS